MRAMSNAVRFAEVKLNKLIETIDRREKTGERETDNSYYVDRHMHIEEDGNRVWSY